VFSVFKVSPVFKGIKPKTTSKRYTGQPNVSQASDEHRSLHFQKIANAANGATDWLRPTQVNVSLKKVWLHGLPFLSCNAQPGLRPAFHICDYIISKIADLGFETPTPY